MASLSKLPKGERDRLIRQYNGRNAQSFSSGQKTEPRKNITEDDHGAESSKVQDTQNNSYENLRKMEEQISADIAGLEDSLAAEISEIEKSATQDALKKTKVLLAKIKELQRLEIQNFTQKLESISSSSNLSLFGYDIFSSH